MNFESLLEKGQSKHTTQIITEFVLNHPKEFKQLIRLMEHGDYTMKQRASWPISEIALKNSEILAPHLAQLVGHLEQENNHPAVTRNIVRAFQFMNFPEVYEGQILDLCFQFMQNQKQPIAVKAFSMTVAYNLSNKYPEIKNELKLTIEQLIPHGSAGIKSRGKRILRQLSK